MADTAAAPKGAGRFMHTLANLPGSTKRVYDEIIAEMKKVTWPDRGQLQDSTIKIVIFVLFIGALIAVMDVILQQVLVRGLPALFGGR